MLHLRVSADVKCPLHPNRSYNVARGGCRICQHLADAQRRAIQVEAELPAAAVLGAELRWKNHRRRATSPPLP